MDVLDSRLDHLRPASQAVYRILTREKSASITALAAALRKNERTVRRALRDLANMDLVWAQADAHDVRRVIWRTTN